MIAVAKNKDPKSDPIDQTVVPSGYKRTEVGVIPENWETRKLGDIGQSLIGLTYDPSNIKPDGLLVLRSSNIGDAGLQFEDYVFVEMEVPERIIVQELDLLICVRNGSRPLIGKCALIDERAEGMTFGAFMAVFRSPYNDFVARCFQSDLIKRQIHEHLGATINQITNRSLNSFLIPFPPPTEQRAIAEVLSDVDKLIEALDDLIAKKQAIKKAAMQQLLTGRIRLPGFQEEWQRKRLGDLGTFAKGRGIRRSDIADTGVPCIRYGELYTRYKNFIFRPESRISEEVAKNSYALETGDLLFAGSGETREEIGRCAAYLGKQPAYAGGDVIIMSPFAGNSMYLGYLMNHRAVAEQKERLAQGDAIVHIYPGNLAEVVIDLPPVEEQDAIAGILSDMDKEISALEELTKKIEKIKMGMMQQLLTGRIRLVEPEKPEVAA